MLLQVGGSQGVPSSGPKLHHSCGEIQITLSQSSTEHQTEFKLQHCPNSYAAIHFLGGLLTAETNSEAKIKFQLMFCPEISTHLAPEKS